MRVHALLLAVILWSIYIWSIATPTLRDRYGNLKGTDFLHFYTIGSVALAHQGSELYNVDSQAALAARRVPEAANIRYLPLYPPQFSLLFAPMARLHYESALALWWTLTVLIYGLCCWAIWKVCRNLQKFGLTAALLCLAYPAFFHLVAWGQTSALALACFTGGFFLLRAEHEFWAGLVLGCLVFKPQLGIAFAVVFLATKSWNVIVGALVSGSGQFAAGIMYFGWAPFREWLRLLANVPSLMPLFEPRPYQTHSLRTFWAMLVPWNEVGFALYAMSATIVLLWTILIWKSREPLALRYAALSLATVLVSLHLTVYDLVILVPGIMLLVDWMVANRSGANGMGTLIYLVCALPLIGPFVRWIHIQLSVVAMVALVYLILRVKLKFSRRAQSSRSETAVQI